MPVPAGGVDYTVQAGDTLLSIGLRFGIEWPVIATANGLSEYSLLQIGQTIRLPGVDSIGGPVAEDTQAAANAVEEESSGDTFVRRYTVQKGDTLVGIATIYGISWEDLAAENRLNKSSVISVGEQLRIPGAVKRVEQPAEATTDENSVQATTETVSAATAITAENTAPEYYVVKAGDTIISIAVRNDMGWQELLTLNNLTENSILQLGQKVRVR
jgi:LysM repeat protein